jgi:hypothetical protein
MFPMALAGCSEGSGSSGGDPADSSSDTMWNGDASTSGASSGSVTSSGDASSGSSGSSAPDGDSGLGGDGMGGRAGTGGDSGTDGDLEAEAAGTVTFTEVYAVLQACSNCHIYQAPGFEQGGQLTFEFQSVSYDLLVGIPASGVACGSSGETRVIPGDSSHSLLYQKISESKPSCGSQMPVHAQPLGSSDVALIARWIDEGAPNN